MSNRLVIAGAGGFGRGVFGWICGSPNFLKRLEIKDIVFIDDTTPKIKLGAPIVNSIQDYIPEASDLAICAIGDPAMRKSIVDTLKTRGSSFQEFIDDRAVVAPNVHIGEGSIICPGVVISAGVRIGEQVHINFNSSIGHDTDIGSFSTLSPAVNLMGELQIGNAVFFGGSATVLPRLAVGSNAKIAAGAVVTKRVPRNVTVKGIPGRWENQMRDPSPQIT